MTESDITVLQEGAEDDRIWCFHLMETCREIDDRI